jgi:tetratricopeptide (TPR) repeat protein
MMNISPLIMLRHNSLVFFSGTLLLLCLLLTSAGVDAAVTASGYSIVLASAPGKNLKWEPRESRLFDDYTIYVEQTTIKDSPWERLCLGFFSPRKEATAILKEVQQVYPGAWVQQVSTKNILSTIHSPTGPDTTAGVLSSTIPKGKAVTGKASSLTDKQLDSLMQRATSDFKSKKYSSSVRYLNALLAAGEHKYSQEALELLGLARQRKGQRTHAVNTYEQYLTLYPDAEGADRVRQRLAGILTASNAPRQKIRMSTAEEDNEITTYGSLSQFYQSNTTSIDDAGTITTLSQLITFFDLATLQRTVKFDHRYQFTADHVYDFIDSDDDSEFRFIEAYYEFNYRKTGSSGRLGRQRLQIGGILKRFDGLTVGYQFNPNMRVNVLGGFPVDIDNKTSINKHKNFYGFTFETGTFLDHWSMNLFYFDQKNDGLTDRNSIGTEVRFRDSSKLLYGLVDYDLFYDEINILQLNTNIVFDRGRTVFLNVLLRKQPLLATDNALIGRDEQSIDELKEVLNIEQIYQLARDRTANSETVTVGGSQPVSEKFQVTADITFTHVDATVASGGVLATPDTGTDYYFSTQLVGNNLWMKYDTGVLGIRYYDTELSDTISFIANTRFPITRHWRINPRLQFDMRDSNDGHSQQKLRALFRTDYRYLNNVRFDFEVGYDQASGDNVGQLLGSNDLFFTLGYRWDF